MGKSEWSALSKSNTGLDEIWMIVCYEKGCLVRNIIKLVAIVRGMYSPEYELKFNYSRTPIID